MIMTNKESGVSLSRCSDLVGFDYLILSWRPEGHFLEKGTHIRQTQISSFTIRMVNFYVYSKKTINMNSMGQFYQTQNHFRPC